MPVITVSTSTRRAGRPSARESGLENFMSGTIPGKNRITRSISLNSDETGATIPPRPPETAGRQRETAPGSHRQWPVRRRCVTHIRSISLCTKPSTAKIATVSTPYTTTDICRVLLLRSHPRPGPWAMQYPGASSGGFLAIP